ncbi:hypothetical protein PROFUN_10417 [Planoprotostelium fungivorum]|uniref:Transmembrane protein n=1 Tax=Planoprotostelium fungivorum TaxID=1890364 RepID=A0A2P6NE23_9EUKA|nr:hypothetical protein PROFUN_10417 [Planoprotostelium fungivorum]
MSARQRLPNVSGSSSWDYIIEGVMFFIIHPELWRHVMLPACCSIIVAIISLGVLLGTALVPQMHLLSEHMATWLAWILAILLVFVESGFVVALVCLILFETYEDRLVVHTMRLRGVELPDKGGTIGFIRQIFFAVIRLLVQVLFFFFSLPIHAIPVVGTGIYCGLNGWVYGWSLHAKYFELKDLSLGQQITFLRKNFMDYTLLGGAGTAMNLVPVAGILFYWTNVVGAALWAADMELGEVAFVRTRTDLWPQQTVGIESEGAVMLRTPEGERRATGTEKQALPHTSIDLSV